jgi:chromosome segregation ATPase
MNAMTVEGLESEGDIAIELAVRDKEIERLREQLLTDAHCPVPPTELMRRQHDEIERLKATLERYSEGIDQRLLEAKIEIERLLATNANLQTAFDEANEEVQRYGAEKAQLRARMQIVREWVEQAPSPTDLSLWGHFLDDRPEAVDWFNEDGVPR